MQSYPQNNLAICLIKNILLLGKNDQAGGPETYF